MHPTAVADAGGLLVLGGLLVGVIHDVAEVVALDGTTLLLAEYLALRHEGSPDRARREFALATQVVQEWFPVRAVAVEAAITALGRDGDNEALASLALAESLGLPLLTKNAEVTSPEIEVLHC